MTEGNQNPAEDVICVCTGTTRACIQELSSQGMDLEAISRWTGAVSGCGGCEWDITAIINSKDRS
ncbi:MAG: (2Fe-2S)-binding protein [Betaproteobacteria bacterium]|nr:(2Fe-2S)-binding protein [Betaproteobacteria bacterium]